jgi:hypothetical protein
MSGKLQFSGVRIIIAEKSYCLFGDVEVLVGFVGQFVC